MPEFGYIIVRNPGPETTLSYGGFTGCREDSFFGPDDVLDEVKKEAKPGDHVHLLTLYDAECGAESQQLTVDSLEEGDTTFSERGQ